MLQKGDDESKKHAILQKIKGKKTLPSGNTHYGKYTLSFLPRFSAVLISAGIQLFFWRFCIPSSNDKSGCHGKLPNSGIYCPNGTGWDGVQVLHSLSCGLLASAPSDSEERGNPFSAISLILCAPTVMAIITASLISISVAPCCLATARE